MPSVKGLSQAADRAFDATPFLTMFDPKLAGSIDLVNGKYSWVKQA